MYDSNQMDVHHLSKVVGMEDEHQSEEDLLDEEVVERWMSYGRQINLALEDADYEQVTALVESRGVFLARLEKTSSRLSDDQRKSLLDAEAELQESMREHQKYIKKKLSGLGRMKLGVRKYTRR